MRAIRRDNQEQARISGAARLAHAVATSTPFAERLVHFWSNHFAVSVNKLPLASMAADYEFRAIRPHVMGNFAQLLRSAVGHPTMLVFLDQVRSAGPGSEAGLRVNRRRGAGALGLNENLARELMELHTLGVRTGYTQEDVTELARALTGWTVAGFARGRAARFAEGSPGETTFVPALHEPGVRTVMGRRYQDHGAEQAQAIIADLAGHPATARHIATKLAKHFISDDPPASAIARLERAFLGSGGHLPTVYAALVAEPEVWAAERTKFRNPWDWLVASLRAAGGEMLGGHAPLRLLGMLGQPLWRPGHPAGWSDSAEDWTSPGALLTRVEIANRLASGPGGRIDAVSRAREVLGDALRPATLDAIEASRSARGVGFALLLASPEFLRR